MYCGECEALLSVFSTACEDYASLVDELHQVARDSFGSNEYLKLKVRAEKARSVCETARAALTAHKEVH